MQTNSKIHCTLLYDYRMQSCPPTIQQNVKHLINSPEPVKRQDQSMTTLSRIICRRAVQQYIKQKKLELYTHIHEPRKLVLLRVKQSGDETENMAGSATGCQ